MYRNAMGKRDCKIENVNQMWAQAWVQAQKFCSVANSTGKLGALDTENASKQQSNDTQCAAMHSGLWSKKTR